MPRTKISPRGHLAAEHRTDANFFIDNVFFALSGLAALWLAWLVLSASFSVGWYLVPFFVGFWLVLAYLVLPRLHRILTSIYVPDYFIGRARTSDGLLGDPINLAAEGSEAQIHSAMTAAGWIKADDVTLRSSWRIVTSTVLRRSYDEAPVSPLLLFGRQQDFAYQQEVAGNPAKRHHVRFWRCPDGWLLPGGHQADWMAAGTFDRAVGFSMFTLQITHKIDADTDIERDHIVQTLTASDEAITVRTIEDFSTGYHSRNGGGDSIETDGDLPVIELHDVDPSGAPDFVDARIRRAARQTQRPLATVLGALLMVLRVVVTLVTVVAIELERRGFHLAAPSELTAYDMEFVDVTFMFILVVTAIFAAFYLFLALKVYQGRNWARITAMSFNAVLIIVTAVTFFVGEKVTLGSDIFGLPLDILILLALSARQSSLWARRDSTPTTR